MVFESPIILSSNLKSPIIPKIIPVINGYNLEFGMHDFCTVKYVTSLLDHLHYCSIRVSDCSIRVSQSFSTAFMLA